MQIAARKGDQLTVLPWPINRAASVVTQAFASLESSRMRSMASISPAPTWGICSTSIRAKPRSSWRKGGRSSPNRLAIAPTRKQWLGSLRTGALSAAPGGGAHLMFRLRDERNAESATITGERNW